MTKNLIPTMIKVKSRTSNKMTTMMMEFPMFMTRTMITMESQIFLNLNMLVLTRVLSPRPMILNFLIWDDLHCALESKRLWTAVRPLSNLKLLYQWSLDTIRKHSMIQRNISHGLSRELLHGLHGLLLFPSDETEFNYFRIHCNDD